MKHTRITFFILIITFLAGFKPVSDWVKYNSNRFTIEFPQDPKIQNQEISSAIGPLQLTLALCEFANGENEEYVFCAGNTIYPDSLINSDKKELLAKFFRGSVDGSVTNVNGKLLSEKEIEINGFPGREYKIEIAEGEAIVKARSYLIKNEMVMMQVISVKAHEETATSQRFFNSFALK